MKFESKLLTVCMLGLAAALPTLRDPEPSQSSLSAASAQGPDAVGSFALQRWGGDRIGGDKLARIDTRSGETWLVELDTEATAKANRPRYRWAAVEPAK